MAELTTEPLPFFKKPRSCAEVLIVKQPNYETQLRQSNTSIKWDKAGRFVDISSTFDFPSNRPCFLGSTLPSIWLGLIMGADLATDSRPIMARMAKCKEYERFAFLLDKAMDAVKSNDLIEFFYNIDLVMSNLAMVGGIDKERTHLDFGGTQGGVDLLAKLFRGNQAICYRNSCPFNHRVDFVHEAITLDVGKYVDLDDFLDRNTSIQMPLLDFDSCTECQRPIGSLLIHQFDFDFTFLVKFVGFVGGSISSILRLRIVREFIGRKYRLGGIIFSGPNQQLKLIIPSSSAWKVIDPGHSNDEMNEIETTEALLDFIPSIGVFLSV